MGKYDDIINLPNHKSAKRKQMSMVERAAQFAPFRSLTGYTDEVEETARLTDTKTDISEAEADILNRRLSYIKDNISDEEISVTYFAPDDKKEGGRYETKRGVVRKTDDIYQKLIFKDRTEIAFRDILKIEGDFPYEL